MIHSWTNFQKELKKWCEAETNQVGQTYTYMYIPEKESILVKLTMPDKRTAKRVITKDVYYKTSNQDITDSVICSAIIQNLKNKFKNKEHIGYT